MRSLFRLLTVALLCVAVPASAQFSSPISQAPPSSLYTSVPFIISVKNVTILTTGTPADIATLTIPGSVARWRSKGGDSNDDAFCWMVPVTWTATQVAATFTVWDAAGGLGNQMSVAAFAGVSSISVPQVAGGRAQNNTYSISHTIYVRQNANSANAGTDDIYCAIWPMPH